MCVTLFNLKRKGNVHVQALDYVDKNTRDDTAQDFRF